MFKNPKLLKIAKLYNKIINDFKVDKVYITKTVSRKPTALVVG